MTFKFTGQFLDDLIYACSVFVNMVFPTQKTPHPNQAFLLGSSKITVL